MFTAQFYIINIILKTEQPKYSTKATYLYSHIITAHIIPQKNMLILTTHVDTPQNQC